MITAESMLSKRPVMRFTLALFFLLELFSLMCLVKYQHSAVCSDQSKYYCFRPIFTVFYIPVYCNAYFKPVYFDHDCVVSVTLTLSTSPIKWAYELSASQSIFNVIIEKSDKDIKNLIVMQKARGLLNIVVFSREVTAAIGEVLLEVDAMGIGAQFDCYGRRKYSFIFIAML